MLRLQRELNTSVTATQDG